MKTRLLLCAVIVLALVLPLFARPMQGWSYDKLKNEADLIVIATPVSVVELKERTTVPGVLTSDAKNQPVPIAAIGLETSFEIQTTLKGTTPQNKFVFYHLREADPPAIARINAPALVSFDLKKNTRYLMFLKKDSDGRYSSVAGQTDPITAIIPLGSYP